MADNLFVQMAIAVGLGLLVGLQREREHSGLAGIRTFPLVALFGLLCGTFSEALGPWTVAAGVLAVAGLTIMANALRARAGGDEPADPGMTTEMAVLVVFGIGVAIAFQFVLPAIVAGAGVTVLLHWKAPLHGFAKRLGQAEFAALMRMVLIALVVLPALPNRAYGPYGVLNPFRIWFVVVLITGISMAGYVLLRFLGTRRGAVAAGLLGGVISSTATAVGYARRSRAARERNSAAAFVVLLASSVAYGRLLLEVGVIAPEVLPDVAGPLAAMAVVMLLASGGLYLWGIESEALEARDTAPPSEIGPALLFGLVYAVVLVAMAFAQDRFGGRGLFAVATLSGLADVNSVTLSVAQLLRTHELAVSTGWRMILVGSLSNLVFKGAIVMALGSRESRVRAAVAFGAAFLGGIAIVLLWPG